MQDQKKEGQKITTVEQCRTDSGDKLKEAENAGLYLGKSQKVKKI